MGVTYSSSFVQHQFLHRADDRSRRRHGNTAEGITLRAPAKAPTCPITPLPPFWRLGLALAKLRLEINAGPVNPFSSPFYSIGEGPCEEGSIGSRRNRGDAHPVPPSRVGGCSANTDQSRERVTDKGSAKSRNWICRHRGHFWFGNDTDSCPEQRKFWRDCKAKYPFSSSPRAIGEWNVGNLPRR